MRAVVESVKVVILCHLWKSEAMRAVLEGGKVFIFSHFWKNEAMRALGERREIPGMGLAGLAGWLARWLAALVWSQPVGELFLPDVCEVAMCISAAYATFCFVAFYCCFVVALLLFCGCSVYACFCFRATVCLLYTSPSPRD